MEPTTKKLRSVFGSDGDGLSHVDWLGCDYHAYGDDWFELSMAWRENLVGDEESGILATGPIISLMDTACSLGAWRKIGGFRPLVTLDLRVDYMRPAKKGATIIGHGECYHLTRSVAFVRGIAHDGDDTDPVAHVAGTFMLI